MSAKRIALNGMLIALSFILSYIERFIPVASITVPGIKLGLANIVALFAIYHLGLGDAFLIMLVRCFLQALLFSGPVQMMFSLFGGTFSILLMRALKNNRHLSAYGVSIAGSAAHNIGQVLVAVIIMQSVAVFSYLSILLIISIPTGIIIASIYMPLNRLFPRKLIP